MGRAARKGRGAGGDDGALRAAAHASEGALELPSRFLGFFTRLCNPPTGLPCAAGWRCLEKWSHHLAPGPPKYTQAALERRTALQGRGGRRRPPARPHLRHKAEAVGLEEERAALARVARLVGVQPLVACEMHAAAYVVREKRELCILSRARAAGSSCPIRLRYTRKLERTLGSRFSQ